MCCKECGRLVQYISILREDKENWK